MRLLIHNAPGPTPLRLEAIGSASFVPGAPSGLPLEVFPLLDCEEPATPDRPTSFRVHHKSEGTKTVWEALYVGADRKEIRVRQVWEPGEKWWSEYQRFVQGQLQLQATRTYSSPAKSEVKLDPKLGRARLRTDSTLDALVTVDELNPELAGILQRLADATALRFTVDESLAGHAPAYGSVQFRNVPARMVMNFVADRQMKNGQWQRINGGYKLLGESAARPRPSKPAPASGTPGDSDGRGGLHWTFWLGLNAVVLVAVCLGIALRRRRVQGRASGASHTSPATKGAARSKPQTGGGQ